jgi:hypothetical protein
MGRRTKTINEVKKDLFRTHGDKISILEYERASVEGLFICNVCSYKL